MANAPQSFREISGLFPTASNEADGVALAIEHFVFGNSQVVFRTFGLWHFVVL